MLNLRKIYAIRCTTNARRAFCLIEVVAALTILVFVTISILTVYDRCMVSAADMTLRMHAFGVARENMENLLATNSVELKVENGQSEKYPDIVWQTSIEGFYEPLTSKTWVQATCNAQYFDAEGIEQTIELKHWLTDVTDANALKAFDQNEPNVPEPNQPAEPNNTKPDDINPVPPGPPKPPL